MALTQKISNLRYRVQKPSQVQIPINLPHHQIFLTLWMPPLQTPTFFDRLNPTRGIFVRNNRLLVTTLMLLRAIASAAQTGSSLIWLSPDLIGYRTPAAIGKAIIL